MWYLKRHLLFGERPFCPHNSLGNRGLPNQKAASQPSGGQPAQHSECQRYARLRRQNRMACCEDQAQQVVVHVTIERHVGFRWGATLTLLEFTPQFQVLAIEHLVAPEMIESASLRHGHK